MKNPWLELSHQAPYVLSDELDTLNKCNTKFEEEFQFKTDIYPEPYTGNIKAPIYLLNLNPGFDDSDITWHSKNEFKSAIKSNLEHKLLDYPFYFLNPNFKESAGGKWWESKLKWLIEDTSLEIVANNIFCAEYFSYHSKKYKEIPKNISATLLNSQKYTMHLVLEALERGVTIIIMRSSEKWFSSIPELSNKKNVYKLKSPQNVCISPNNLDNYNNIVEILKKC